MYCILGKFEALDKFFGPSDKSQIFVIKNECEVKAGFDPAALFQVREAKNDVENKSGRDSEALYSGDQP